MKKFVKLMLFAGFFAMSAASAQQFGALIARVSVLSPGKLLLNDQPTTLAELDAKLQQLKSKRGAVWYYRPDALAEPSVVRPVVKYALPISMSTQPNFSDYADDQGHAHALVPSHSFKGGFAAAPFKH